MTTIIHTSDWHLGHRLERQERTAEQQAFLAWLLEQLRTRETDALLVCGDIFDVANPPIDAVRMLYGFLAEARRVCPNIVLVGGNHDSGARLDAMAPLLEALGITVVGSMPDDPARCILTLQDRAGNPVGTIAAVPYLRAGDLAAAQADEDVDAQHSRVLASIRTVYETVLEAVSPDAPAPLVVTGHLFARGGIETEGERAAHVEAGKLLGVTPDVFGERAAYVALGHLHRHQAVRKSPPVIYSGTPVPLSFGEAEQTQMVVELTVSDGSVVDVTELPVPRATQLYDVVGQREAVFQRLSELSARHPLEAPGGWLRVTVEETEPDPGVRDAVVAAVAETSLQLLAVRRRVVGEEAGLADARVEHRLEEMSPEAVFDILYRQRYESEPDPELVDAFAAVLQDVLEEDSA